jgi:DnaK suppressor protein
MISSETLAMLKQRLERERRELEEGLKKIAVKDPNVPGDWDTKFPQFEGSVAHPEESASEVEEYDMLLDVEHNLEVRLKEVNEALEKIVRGTYGMCAKCGKEIPAARLQANPAAATCVTCAE